MGWWWGGDRGEDCYGTVGDGVTGPGRAPESNQFRQRHRGGAAGTGLVTGARAEIASLGRLARPRRLIVITVASGLMGIRSGMARVREHGSAAACK